MNQTIKNPTWASGVQILLNDKAKSIKGNYTQTFNTKFALCKYFLVNYWETPVITYYTTVSNLGKVSKYWYANLQNLVKTIADNNFISIIGVITSFSGINRTRQQAVFLRPLYFLYFGLCYKLKTVYGGLREGNINNTLRRLNAVIETCHPIKVVVLLNRSGGHND